MKNIVFYSPDLNLCVSLLMYLQNKYKVTTTTDFEVLQTIVKSASCDLVIIDAEPSSQTETFCRELKNNANTVPIILTYVYKNQFKENDNKLRKYVDSIFYKPIDLIEVSKQVNNLITKRFN